MAPACFQDAGGSSMCKSCPDPSMITTGAATSVHGCRCPVRRCLSPPFKLSTRYFMFHIYLSNMFLTQRGYYVSNWKSATAPEQCEMCDASVQLCDEEHQQLPKPSIAGIWIDPADGSAVVCEPYVACVQHRSVEATLSAKCAEGYVVSGIEPLGPVRTVSENSRVLTCHMQTSD